MPSTSYQPEPAQQDSSSSTPRTEPLAAPTGAPAAPPALPAPPYYSAPPSHSGATIALVLGILGVVSVPFLAPVAWFMGNSALAEIDAQPGMYSNREHANVGRILGMVGTALLAVFVLAMVAMFGVWIVMIIGIAATG